MEDLRAFSAGSANDESHMHLWMKGASLFIPQLNRLLEHTDHLFTIIHIDTFDTKNSDELGNIFEHNCSDKSTGHNYHILYSFILNTLGVNNALNILEIGLGTNNPHLVSTMGYYGKPGASLYAFREYLPNANIYGGDIDKDILFEADRIRTSYVNQLEIQTLYDMRTRWGNITFDLIIDDGLHSIGANFNTLLFALDSVKQGGWIVIEDIHIKENWKSIDFILHSTKKVKTYFIQAQNGYLYAIQKVS